MSVLVFLDKLKEAKIFHRLSAPTDALMVEVDVPGEKWEIEFHGDGNIDVEVFRSTGQLRDSSALDELFARFTD